MTDLVLAALALPDGILPDHLARRLTAFGDAESARNTAFAESLQSGTPFPLPVDTPTDLLDELDPYVSTFRAQAVLFALAFEMTSKTTLQNALAFLVVAIADYQGQPITVTDIVRRAERDLEDNPVFTGNLRRSYVDLLDQKLISAKPRTDAENFNDLRLTEKGISLAARVNARVNGNLFEPN